jgi:hypothetical protein
MFYGTLSGKSKVLFEVSSLIGVTVVSWIIWYVLREEKP